MEFEDGSAKVPLKIPDNDGPMARTTIFFGCVPVTIKPPISALLPVSTFRRVEIFPSLVGVPAGVGVRVIGGVGVGVPGVPLGVGVGVIVGVGVGVPGVPVGVGVGGGVVPPVKPTNPLLLKVKNPRTSEGPDPGMIRLKNKVTLGVPSFHGFHVAKLIPLECAPPG